VIWQWTPYTIPLVVAALTTTLSAWYIWRNRDTTSSRTGAWLLLAVANWILGYALEQASANLPAKIFWAKIKFLSICFIPTAWLIYIIQYTGREKWLTRRNLALLGIVPLAFWLLVLTNELHGLAWSSIHLDIREGLAIKHSTYGPGLWIYATYSYALIVVSTLLLIQTLVRSGRLYRWQARALLLAVFVVWLINLLIDISKPKSLLHLEMTPIALSLTAPVIAWSLYHLRHRDIVPVARTAVIESMNDGVIVLDAQDRIVDLNPAAGRLVECVPSEAIGQRLDRLWSGRLEHLQGDLQPAQEITIDHADQRRTFDVRVSPLTDWRGRLMSRVIVLRDITERVEAQEKLDKANKAIADQLAFTRTLIDAIPNPIFAKSFIPSCFNPFSSFRADGKRNNLFKM